MDLNKIAEAQRVYAEVLTGNSEDAKDLLQDCLYKILVAKKKPTTETEMGFFFRTCLKRLSIDYYRWRKKHRAFISDYSPETTFEIPIQLRIDIQNAYSDMQFLRPIDAAALKLHVEGYKDSEICRILGESRQNTVTCYIHKAKKKMRELRCQQDQ
jgi:DNA-directed RNA polymerase specialized sigma24 family protein